MKIFIKNMVCQGTKKFVELELKKLGFKYHSFELGEIDFEQGISQADIQKLDYSLHKYGLEVIFSRSKVVRHIRLAVLGLVNNNIKLETSFSYYITNKVGYSYSYLNSFFNKVTGMPIEEYYLEKISERTSSKEQSWADVLNHKN